MTTSRRQFLSAAAGSSMLLSLSPVVPNFLISTSAHAAAAKKQGEKILVVVQLSGGNDGLNTVIPVGDDIYHKSRFTVRVQKEQALKIDDYLGFHPAMTGFAELLQQQQLAIVQGIGYPNPDRSHFSSMDIWHAGQRDVQAMRRLTGWLGRYLDRRAAPAAGKPAVAGSLGDVPALHLGHERQPLAVVAENVRVPSIASVDSFKLDAGGNTGLARAINESVGAPRSDAKENELLGFIQQSTVTAIKSSDQLHDAMRNYQTDVNYPGTGLAKKLRTIAQLIDAGMPTRIYYVSLEGFDTHANQAQVHANQIRELSDACAAFIKDLKAHGQDERVLVLSFSEFGRRLKENASRGTDHGTAAPLFVMGSKVKAGVIGAHPSLKDLDDSGDPKHHTDFRQVYATLLDQWLGGDSAAVLGQKFEHVKVLKA